jgi:hypothetical protein
MLIILKHLLLIIITKRVFLSFVFINIKILYNIILSLR